jgi:protein-S-isoprenylcysteine O-methyltransferase Ste14
MSEKDNAGVLALPPLIFGAAFLIGVGLDSLVRLPFSQSLTLPRMLLAAVLAMLGAVLGVSAVAAFRKVGTNVLPEHPSTAITTQSAYRFTRNPMYLGLSCFYAAAAIALAKPVTLALLPVAMLIVHHGVILREERYLAAKFGETYEVYRRRVRRWL